MELVHIPNLPSVNDCLLAVEGVSRYYLFYVNFCFGISASHILFRFTKLQLYFVNELINACGSLFRFRACI